MALSNQPSNYWRQLKRKALYPAVLSVIILMLTSFYFSAATIVIFSVLIICTFIMKKMYDGFTGMVQRQAISRDSAFYVPAWYSFLFAAVLIFGFTLLVSSFLVETTGVDWLSITDVRFAVVTLFATAEINALFWLYARNKVQKNWSLIKKNHRAERDKTANGFNYEHIQTT